MRRRGECRKRRDGGHRRRATPERRQPTEEPPWMNLMSEGVRKGREGATAEVCYRVLWNGTKKRWW